MRSQKPERCDESGPVPCVLTAWEQNGEGEGGCCLTVFVQPLLLGFMDLDLKASPTLTGFPADPLSTEKEGYVKPMEEKTPAGQPIVDREKVRRTVHVTTDSPVNHLFSDGTLSHTGLCQSWRISSPGPIPRWSSSDRRRVADIHMVRSTPC